MAVSFSRAALFSIAILDDNARPLPATPVTVRTTTGALASLYADSTKASVAPNPAYSDASGNLTVWADPGLYTLETASGGAVRAVAVLIPPDPDDLDINNWHHRVDADMPSYANSGWNTYVARNSTESYQSSLTSGGTQNAYVQYRFPMSAGTWTLYIAARKNTDRGIISARLDNVERATFDLYAASPAAASSTTTGITVASSKLVTLELNMATKNASSSSYVGHIYLVALTRTA